MAKDSYYDAVLQLFHLHITDFYKKRVLTTCLLRKKRMNCRLHAVHYLLTCLLVTAIWFVIEHIFKHDIFLFFFMTVCFRQHIWCVREFSWAFIWHISYTLVRMCFNLWLLVLRTHLPCHSCVCKDKWYLICTNYSRKSQIHQLFESLVNIRWETFSGRNLVWPG